MNNDKTVLVEAFKNGDEWAFTQIDKRFRKPLYKYLFQFTRNAQTTEEVAQEVFIKLYRFREQYNSKYNFPGWFWKIVKNTVIDWKRKNRIECAEDLSSEKYVHYEGLACQSPSAEALVIGKAQKKRILKMLRGLTKLQKRVLWFRLIHRLSYSEISKSLGISITAAKCAAYRARKDLTGFVQILSPNECF